MLKYHNMKSNMTITIYCSAKTSNIHTALNSARQCAIVRHIGWSGFEISRGGRGGGGGGGAKHFLGPLPLKETVVQSLHSGYILAVGKEIIEVVEK